MLRWAAGKWGSCSGKKIICCWAITLCWLVFGVEYGLPADADLHAAVRKGDLATVKNRVSYGADINAATSQGETLLHKAVQYGHQSIAVFLLQHGAQANVRNSDGNTPLHYAAGQGRPDLVELLLAHQGDVNARNSQPWTFLRLVTELGQREVAKFLNPLEKEKEKQVWQNRGETALHRAVQGGSGKTIRLLLSHGAEVNAKNEYNDQTPLHVAAGFGSPEILSLLLMHGAERDAQMTLPLTPTDLVQYLLTPLHLAALAGRREATQLLLASSANVNAKVQVTVHKPLPSADTSLGTYNRLTELDSLADMTPLHFAAFSGQGEVVQLLLAHGAEVDVMDSAGRTPLHLTSLWDGAVTAAEQLLAHGAAVNAKDDTGATPLQAAEARKQKVLIELFLAYGAKATTPKKKREVQTVPTRAMPTPLRSLFPTERSW